MEADNRGVTVRFMTGVMAVFEQREAVRGFQEALTVGEALRQLCSTPERERALFQESGELRPSLRVLVNGRSIVFLDEMHTSLQDGDVVSVMSPIAGG